MALACVAFAALSPVHAQEPSVAGYWTGEATQSDGSTYVVLMNLTDSGGGTNYPSLNCAGTLTRVGSANGYVFLTETITQGGVAQGGTCIDGSITVALTGEGLAWSWTGQEDGIVSVAWGDLRKK